MGSDVSRRGLFGRLAAVVGVPVAVVALASRKARHVEVSISAPDRENSTYRRYSGYEVMDIAAGDVFTAETLIFQGIPIEFDRT